MEPAYIIAGNTYPLDFLPWVWIGKTKNQSMWGIYLWKLKEKLLSVQR
jgi:hypothetical protein